jgi:DNA-binding response OmpR family regulator
MSGIPDPSSAGRAQSIQQPAAERAVHVLLVEDDESLRPILARHLATKGFRVAEAGSAEEATADLESGLRPGLVLLDLNLPGSTGWEFLRGPALARAGNPPVVVTTATTVNPRRLREFAVAGYLPKPFAMETLVATVERFVGERP